MPHPQRPQPVPPHPAETSEPDQIPASDVSRARGLDGKFGATGAGSVGIVRLPRARVRPSPVFERERVTPGPNPSFLPSLPTFTPSLSTPAVTVRRKTKRVVHSLVYVDSAG
eukprot:3532167-Rhodomonas_salina.1